MKITILKSQLFRTGGLEKYTWNIAAAFCKKGFPVTILTTGKVTPAVSRFTDPNLKIFSFPIDYPLSSLNVYHFDKACQSYLRDHPTSIVFSLDRNRSQTHLRAGNGVHASYLQRRSQEEGFLKRCSFALNPLHKCLLKLEKHAFEDPSLQVLFTNSHMVKNEILSLYKTDPQKIQVIHNGVEWHEMKNDFTLSHIQRPSFAKEFGLDLTSYQFLFIGNNYHRKGLEKLLYALASLPHKNFELSVIGKEKNISYFQALKRKLNLKDQIHFFGERCDVRSFYKIADALIIPSLYDPFANVTVEALAMGVFVVSSKTNGGHEVLTQENGVIIDDLNDCNSVAQALETAMNHPKTLQSSQRVRDSIQHLDFENQLSSLCDVTLGRPTV